MVLWGYFLLFHSFRCDPKRPEPSLLEEKQKITDARNDTSDNHATDRADFCFSSIQLDFTAESGRAAVAAADLMQDRLQSF